MQRAVDLLSLSGPDGTRPVNARWEIAHALVSKVATKRSFKNVLDQYVTQAMKYIEAWDRCGAGYEFERVAHQFPELHAANQLYANSDMSERNLVEARLLAGMSIEQVAAACNLAVETIEWYEAIFFRVIGYLDRHHYITNYAIGRRWAKLSELNDVDVFIKRAGFLGGPDLVDRFVRYYAFDWRVASRIRSLSLDQMNELMSMIEVKMLILSWVSPFEQDKRYYKLRTLSNQLQALINVATNKARDPLPALDLAPFTDDLLGVGSTSQDTPGSDEPVDALA